MKITLGIESENFQNGVKKNSGSYIRLQIPEIRWGQGELKESYSTVSSAADVFKP